MGCIGVLVPTRNGILDGMASDDATVTVFPILVAALSSPLLGRIFRMRSDLQRAQGKSGLISALVQAAFFAASRPIAMGFKTYCLRSCRMID